MFHRFYQLNRPAEMIGRIYVWPKPVIEITHSRLLGAPVQWICRMEMPHYIADEIHTQVKETLISRLYSDDGTLLVSTKKPQIKSPVVEVRFFGRVLKNRSGDGGFVAQIWQLGDISIR